MASRPKQRIISTKSLLWLFAANLLLIVVFGASATAFVFRSSSLVDQTITDSQIWEQQLARGSETRGAIARLSIPQVERLRTDPIAEQQRILDELESLMDNVDAVIANNTGRPNETSLPPNAIALFNSIATQLRLAATLIQNTSFADFNATNGLNAGSETLAAQAKAVNSQIDAALTLMVEKRDQTMADHSNQSLKLRERNTVIGLIALATAVLSTVFGRRLVRSIHLSNLQRERDLAEIGETAAALNYANNKLAQSNRDLMGFAFVASHDLQEPLRKIIAFGDRLENRAAAELDDTSKDYLLRMKNAASRMQQLIEDLLAYSRTATGRADLKEIDLGDVIAGVLSDMEITIERSGAIIEVGKLPQIEADPTQIRQLVQNLISNSIKFRRQDVAPRIAVTATKLTLDDPVAANLHAIHPNAQQWWRFCVSDNGIGFDQQYADKVFVVFQRLNGRDEFEGSGLGLAVARRIVERHGGEISADSRLGHGTTFSFVLPRKQVVTSEPAPITQRNTEVVPSSPSPTDLSPVRPSAELATTKS
jgi:signal transduction histidine kinase